MKKSSFLKTSLFGLCAVAALGLGAWYFAFGRVSSPAKTRGTYRGRIAVTNGTAAASGKRAVPRRTRSGEEKVRPAAVKVRPDLKLDASDEAKMSAAILAIYRDLQDALDKDDRKKVFALVHKLQSLDEWPDGIPASVKRRALDALAWFGAPGIAEAVGFLADSDPSIREDAMDTFQQQFEDSWDLGDYKLAETMKSVVKVVTDADHLESYMEQFMNMRDTVKADLALSIYDSGNQTAVEVLEKNLDSYFDADGYTVTNREGVERFKKDADQVYKDDPSQKQEDDQMYGPQNWNW